MRAQAKKNINRHPRYYLALGLIMAVVLLTGGVLLSLTQRIDESQDLRRSAQVTTGQPQLVVTPIEAEVGREAVLPITVKNFKDVTAADVTVLFGGKVVAIEPNETHSNIPGVIITKREIITPSNAVGFRYQVTSPNGTTLPDSTILFSIHFIPSRAGNITATIDAKSIITTTQSAGQNVLTSRTPATVTVIASRGELTPACAAPSILVPPGVSMYEQFLHPGGYNVVSYEVDFEGNDIWQPASTTDPRAHGFYGPRVYNPKFRVIGANGIKSVICNYPFSVLVYGNQGDIPAGPMDQLQESTRQRSGAADTPGTDDLFLSNVQDGIYSGSTLVDTDDLEIGKQYRYRITGLVQNTVKVPTSTDNQAVIVRLDANNSGSDTFNFSYGELLRTAAGVRFTLESPFIATEDIKIETRVDSEKVIAEYNENNNEHQIDLELESEKSQNKKTNTVTFANSCNKYCADVSECSFGLICQNNRCRHPQNTGAESCAGPGSTVPGCNMTCDSSADCAAGLFCTSGSCRNPSNPGSVTCAARSTSAAVGGPSKGTSTATPTPRPSTPTATATPRPSATPRATATPAPTIPTFPASGSAQLDASASAPLIVIPNSENTATPPPVDTTVADDFTNWFNGLGLPAGITLGTLLIAGGVGLLLLVLLIAILRSRGSKTYLEPLPATKPVTSFTPMPGVLQKGSAPSTHNPPPASASTLPGKEDGVTLLPGQRPQSTPQTTSATGTKGVTPEPKSPIPQAPQASSAPTSSSSMVQKLQEKGITLDK